MNYYETLYIIHPALDSGRIKEMILSVDKILQKNGGERVSLDVWGKKKLAYEVDKQKYGTYILTQFTGDGSGNIKFNMELEHNPNVLAYLTTRINESKLHEQTLSLDEQIRGDNPSPSSSQVSTNKENSNKPADKAESNVEEVTKEVSDEDSNKPADKAESNVEEVTKEVSDEDSNKPADKAESNIAETNAKEEGQQTTDKTEKMVEE